MTTLPISDLCSLKPFELCKLLDARGASPPILRALEADEYCGHAVFHSGNTDEFVTEAFDEETCRLHRIKAPHVKSLRIILAQLWEEHKKNTGVTGSSKDKLAVEPPRQEEERSGAAAAAAAVSAEPTKQKKLKKVRKQPFPVEQCEAAPVPEPTPPTPRRDFNSNNNNSNKNNGDDDDAEQVTSPFLSKAVANKIDNQEKQGRTACLKAEQSERQSRITQQHLRSIKEIKERPIKHQQQREALCSEENSDRGKLTKIESATMNSIAQRKKSECGRIEEERELQEAAMRAEAKARAEEEQQRRIAPLVDACAHFFQRAHALTEGSSSCSLCNDTRPPGSSLCHLCAMAAEDLAATRQRIGADGLARLMKSPIPAPFSSEVQQAAASRKPNASHHSIRWRAAFFRAVNHNHWLLLRQILAHWRPNASDLTTATAFFFRKAGDRIVEALQVILCFVTGADYPHLCCWEWQYQLFDSAVDAGFPKMTKLLLENDVRLAALEETEPPLLVVAAQGKKPAQAAAVVKVLVDAGADVNEAVDMEQGSAFLVAAENDNVPVAQALLSQPGARVDIDSDMCFPDGTALSVAARRGCTAMMEVLIEAGASLDSADSDGLRPIHLAVVSKKLDAVRLLLRRRPADANLPISDTDGFGSDTIDGENIGRSPAHYAAEFFDADVFAELVAAGCDFNHRAILNVTPLHLAVEAGSRAAVRALLALSVDKDVFGNRHTPLMRAVALGKLDLISDLVSGGCNLSLCSKELRHKPTALHIACKQGDAAVVRLLLLAGAEKTARDSEGRTALEWAKMSEKPLSDDVLESLK